MRGQHPIFWLITGLAVLIYLEGWICIIEHRYPNAIWLFLVAFGIMLILLSKTIGIGRRRR